MDRRSFFKGILAVTVVAAAPVVWTARKIYRIVNVKDFGAVGDGTTDDSKALRDAFDAAGPGGKVFFPPGTYRI